MTVEELKSLIASGAIDTVLVAAPDKCGRFVGKRYTGTDFVESALEHGSHGCNYLMAVDINMDPQDGFKLVSWDQGFGDFAMTPDLSTLRALPWQPGAALVICDLNQEDGSPVAEAPRNVLRRAITALAEAGCEAFFASELEMFVYHTDYPAAFKSGYRDLKPVSDYRIDYHIMQPLREEDLFRRIRNELSAAGIPIENTKGEWGIGQHEVNMKYAPPLEMADRHILFKQGCKEIAQQTGRSLTFMAKPFAGEAGNSCHIHVSLFRDGKNAFWDAGKGGGSLLFRQFLGGLIKYCRELCYFFAPTVNSYKRFEKWSWAPTRQAWSYDNRTVAFRVVGKGQSFRIENRTPGGDANPYMAYSAMLAAGLAGIRENLDCGDVYKGNAYVDDTLAEMPHTLRGAVALLRDSALAKEFFGADVVEHHAHTGSLEADAFDRAVTDWERQRYFEQI
ncbi:MAG: glutamine synthetase [Verrucomicrobiales bacterium]|nr:glutamine synthetase [Verrucomicrobiales bacterium]